MASTKGTIKPGTDENVISIDARGVGERKEGGKVASGLVGDFLLKIRSAKNVAVRSGKNAGKRQIAWLFEIVGTPDDAESKAGLGCVIYLNTMVEWADPEKQGWFLTNLLEDLLGATIRGTATKLTLDDKAGKLLGATLADGDPYDYENKDTGEVEQRTRSEIKYTFPASRFVGFVPGGAGHKGEDSGSAKSASPTKAAEQVATADEGEDTDELDVQSI